MHSQQVTDPGSERAVLSGICQYGKEAFVDVSDIITTASFTIENNQAIYKCLESIFQETSSIDIASVLAKADQLNLTYLVSKKNEDIDYLRALFNFPIKLENIRVHAQRIAKIEVIRKAQQKHIEAYQDLSKCDGSENIDHILGISEKPIFQMITEISCGRESSPVILGDKSDEYLNMVENTDRSNLGIPTPFPVYNHAIGGGIRRGGVALIVTRPKGRKSTTALIVGLHVSNLKIPVLYIDTEMTYEDQIPRALANLSRIDIGKIERGEYVGDITEKRCIYEANKKFKGLPFHHKSVNSKKFDDILSIIRRWVVTEVGYADNGRTNNCLVIYDYFKIMNTADLNDLQEYQAVGYQISALADFAKEYDIPILAFNQVNREGITKETSDIMSQSDRLTWLCTSAALLKRKEPEEMIQDGKENGNMKLLILDNMTRYGPGLDIGDYINIQLYGSTFSMKECGTRNTAQQIKNTTDNGFDVKIEAGDF